MTLEEKIKKIFPNHEISFEHGIGNDFSLIHVWIDFSNGKSPAIDFDDLSKLQKLIRFPFLSIYNNRLLITGGVR